jgi:hypothetical protein
MSREDTMVALLSTRISGGKVMKIVVIGGTGASRHRRPGSPSARNTIKGSQASPLTMQRFYRIMPNSARVVFFERTGEKQVVKVRCRVQPMSALPSNADVHPNVKA